MAHSNHIQSVLKAAEMLRIVGESEGGIKLKQIAEAMQQKLPAIHHLSTTLLSCGFLMKRPDNVLVLGHELIRLADKACDDTFLDAASSEMSRIYNSFPYCVVVLAVLNAPKVDLALRISYERPNVIQKEQGQIFNIYVNAVGLISLAFAETEESELLMDKLPFSEYGAHLWKNWDNFAAYLSEIRTAGLAVCPFDQEVSLRIAAPIKSLSGKLKGALGVSVPASKVKPETAEALKREILKSATSISEKIQPKKGT